MDSDRTRLPSFSRSFPPRASGPRRAPRALLLLSCTFLLAWAWQSAPPALTRGPYLQSQTTTGITVVFRLSPAAGATVRYGPHPGVWEGSKTLASAATQVAELTGLRPDTQYYYQLESGGSVLAGGEDHSFRTSPPGNAHTPFRFLAWGDSGNGSSTQRDVARRMEEVFPQPSFALGLGDLVYDAGQWENYDPNLFQPYANLFTRLVFWPTLGNHDYGTQSGAPYLDAFYLPKQSGAPGHPSNTEKYYSFDQGMAHFVCADSESSSSSPGSAMYTWISDDLDDARARGKRWLFVFMHHPPYTHGTHNSDTETELITLRHNLVPLFEAKGVDLVMVGHSHVYERSYLARGDRIYQNDPADYTKISSPNGTIYLVSGCGGESGTGPLDHPLMANSHGNVAGFSLIDVSWDDVRGSFVERDGTTHDLFRLHKTADVQPPRVETARATSATRVEVEFDEPLRAGNGAGGAENLGSYLLSNATVLSADLLSDERTVALTTTSLTQDRATMLSVQGVADLAGHAGILPQRLYLALAAVSSSGGGTGSGGVPRGSTWRYFKGTTAPPGAWATLAFDDSSWSQGRASFGYDYTNQGTVLSDMKDRYVSVFLRTPFTVADPALVSGLALAVSYDDGFVAYLNGTEIARGNMPAGAITYTTLASSSHEVAGFEPFDVARFKSALVPGRNVLAVQGHNFTLASPDFALDPELGVTRTSGASSGPPVAFLDSDARAANAPARVSFSAGSSLDPDGGPLRFVWDFGDGTRGFGRTVEHLYPIEGAYDVALIVRDGQALDAVEHRTLRIQSVGTAPVAQLSASRTVIHRGDRVDFGSGGSLDPDGGSTWAYWDFGDPLSGEANASTAPSASHVFARPGLYTVRLAITDDESSTVSRTVLITVQ